MASRETVMADRRDTCPGSTERGNAFRSRHEVWSENIKQACEFFVARAVWVWLILSIGLIAGVLATT